jgi:transcriptional regulator GlxA family with amidase domain
MRTASQRAESDRFGHRREGGFACGFLLLDGFSNMVLASAMEPLRAAHDISGLASLRWQLLTLDGGPAVSSSGLVVQPQAALGREAAMDTLFVVAGYGFRAFVTPSLLQRLRRIARRVATLAGLDTGAWLLAAAGLLEQRRATIHWQELDAFQEAYPGVRVSSERYVIDGPRITAGGATTVMDLMIRLIREHAGNALAFDVSNLFIYDVEHGPRGGRGARSRSLVARAPQLIRAIAEMRRTVAEPVTLDRISASAHCSARTLERLFLREMELPAGRYYQMTRLRHARDLAEETDLNTAEIAERTGFASSSTLSRAFSGHFGITIRDLRKHRLQQQTIKRRGGRTE